ncbi:MAG TPA: hypothetical protein PK777_13645, partial [Thermoguttaceae bacterium]|nr:hypothetical protein [Thermoguttaceae bacterium]
ISPLRAGERIYPFLERRGAYPILEPRDNTVAIQGFPIVSGSPHDWQKLLAESEIRIQRRH